MKVSPLTCLVTGTTGYVGSRIVNHLRNRGNRVFELRRRVDASHDFGKFMIPFSLEEGIDEKVFENVDAFVHCAYDFQPIKWDDIRKVNVDGSIQLLRAAKRAGVSQIVLISTMSAFDGCKSLYGRAKMMIEKEACDLGAVVLRLGLIYGRRPRAMAGALNQMVKRLRIVPLIGSGNQILYLCHEADLGRLVYAVCRGEASTALQPLIAAEPTGKPLKEILRIFAEANCRRVFFVPIPWQLIWLALKMGESLNIPLGFRSDSLISLLHQNPNPNFQETERLGLPFREFTPQTAIQP